jgi:hypothetical protein
MDDCQARHGQQEAMTEFGALGRCRVASADFTSATRALRKMRGWRMRRWMRYYRALKNLGEGRLDLGASGNGAMTSPRSLDGCAFGQGGYTAED